MPTRSNHFANDQPFRVGDRIRILRPEYTKDGHELGTITHIDGAYIDIRPDDTDWEMEAYDNEIEHINSGFGEGKYKG